MMSKKGLMLSLVFMSAVLLGLSPVNSTAITDGVIDAPVTVFADSYICITIYDITGAGRELSIEIDGVVIENITLSSGQDTCAVWYQIAAPATGQNVKIALMNNAVTELDAFYITVLSIEDLLQVDVILNAAAPFILIGIVFAVIYALIRFGRGLI